MSKTEANLDDAFEVSYMQMCKHEADMFRCPSCHHHNSYRWHQTTKPYSCLFAWGLTALSAQIGYIAP